MSEQPLWQPDIVYKEDGWRAVAEQMNEWHPGLQQLEALFMEVGQQKGRRGVR